VIRWLASMALAFFAGYFFGRATLRRAALEATRVTNRILDTEPEEPMSQHETAPTFESVNAHVEAIDLAKFSAGGAHHFTAAHVKSSPSDVLLKVCTVYRAVRPILGWVAWIPLPAKWKQALATFQGLMDGLCPTRDERRSVEVVNAVPGTHTHR
jgi:hypothetical protein